MAGGKLILLVLYQGRKIESLQNLQKLNGLLCTKLDESELPVDSFITFIFFIYTMANLGLCLS